MQSLLTEHSTLHVVRYEHRDPEIFYHPIPKNEQCQKLRRSICWSGLPDLALDSTLFFFGGEPLLKRDIIERICKAIDAEEIPGVETRPAFAMITNACCWKRKQESS